MNRQRVRAIVGHYDGQIIHSNDSGRRYVVGCTTRNMALNIANELFDNLTSLQIEMVEEKDLTSKDRDKGLTTVLIVHS